MRGVTSLFVMFGDTKCRMVISPLLRFSELVASSCTVATLTPAPQLRLLDYLQGLSCRAASTPEIVGLTVAAASSSPS